MRLLRSPAAVAILLGGFYFALGLGVPQYNDFQRDSERLLAGSAARAAADGSGVWGLGGFMNAHEGGWDTPDPSPYYSQFGLHYKVYTWVSGFFPQHPSHVYVAFRLLAALLTGAVLAWAVNSVRRDHGPVAALVMLLLLAGSSPLIAFAAKVYWLECLLILPFAYSLARYESMRRQGRLGRLYATVGLLILVKSLCGYEYLSSILLSAMVPLLYHELAAGSGPRLILRRMAFTFAAGVCGFAVAYATTYAQAYLYLGTTEAAWKAILRSAGANTVGDHQGRPVSAVRDVARFFQYFLFEGQAQIVLFTAGAWVIYRALAVYVSRRNESRPAFVWGVTLAFALVASLSWNALARGHMRGHIHINFITFYLPFNLVAYAFFGVLVQDVVDGSRNVSSGSDSFAFRDASASDKLTP
jgi:hypothetical protein